MEINAEMQKTNQRLYNKMLALDNWIAANLDATYSWKFTTAFTTFLNSYSDVTTTVQGQIDTLAKRVNIEADLLTTIAGKSDNINALSDATSSLNA